MSTQTISAQKITAEVSIPAPASQLYYLVSTRSGWLDWFAMKGHGWVGPGGILQLYHDKVEQCAFVFHELVQDERVQLSTLDPKTLATSEVEIELIESDGGTTLSVTQAGLDDDEAARWQGIWQESLESLKEILETGKDPRLWNRPFLGVTVEEWVTSEYATEHDLEVEYGMRLSSVFEGKGAEQAGMRGGDVFLSLDGVDLVNYEALLNVYKGHTAGDTLPVTFYQDGEIKQADLTLSAYPVPEVPATNQDLADTLDAFFQKANAKINQLLAGQSDAQASYRPAAGEWNAKEVLAHLIGTESDSIVWLSSYIGGREVYANTGNVPARIKMITSMYPTVDKLVKKLEETQQELVALVREVSAEVAGRKTSMIRLAFAYSFDISLHYRDHLGQLKETLEMASDVRPS